MVSVWGCDIFPLPFSSLDDDSSSSFEMIGFSMLCFLSSCWRESRRSELLLINWNRFGTIDRFVGQIRLYECCVSDGTSQHQVDSFVLVERKDVKLYGICWTRLRKPSPPHPRSFSIFFDGEKKIRMKCSNETRWRFVSDGQKFSSFDILCCPSGNCWRRIFTIDEFVALQRSPSQLTPINNCFDPFRAHSVRSSSNTSFFLSVVVVPCRDHLHRFADLVNPLDRFERTTDWKETVWGRCSSRLVMKICPSFRVTIWRMDVSFINEEDFPSIEMKMLKRIEWPSRSEE